LKHFLNLAAASFYDVLIMSLIFSDQTFVSFVSCSDPLRVPVNPAKPVTSATRPIVAPPEHRFIQVNNCFVSEFVHLHHDVNGQDAHEVVGLEAADVVHGPSVRVLMFFFLLSFIYLNHPN
jgi:hypothetical protein